MAGFTAIVLCSVWSLLHRNWVELAAAVGLGAGLLICLSWRRARRTAAEKAPEQERIFIGAVLDSVPGIPYMFDAEGRLVRWNKKRRR